MEVDVVLDVAVKVMRLMLVGYIQVEFEWNEMGVLVMKVLKMHWFEVLKWDGIEVGWIEWNQDRGLWRIDVEYFVKVILFIELDGKNHLWRD